MNSEEALTILFASYYYNGNYQEVIEAREKIEKDLEVLEIIKNKRVSVNTLIVSIIGAINPLNFTMKKLVQN